MCLGNANIQLPSEIAHNVSTMSGYCLVFKLHLVSHLYFCRLYFWSLRNVRHRQTNTAFWYTVLHSSVDPVYSCCMCFCASASHGLSVASEKMKLDSEPHLCPSSVLGTGSNSNCFPHMGLHGLLSMYSKLWLNDQSLTMTAVALWAIVRLSKSDAEAPMIAPCGQNIQTKTDVCLHVPKKYHSRSQPSGKNLRSHGTNARTRSA